MSERCQKPAECPQLPVTAEELAAAAREAVRAGAEEIHLHPKNAAGDDTMEPAYVAAALLAGGVGIEAGIFSGTDAAHRFRAWPESHRALRVLAEITDTDPRTAPLTAASLLDDLGPGRVLLHGEDAAAWTILVMAASRGLDTRIGLEDVLHLPDGTPATSNADLVGAARLLMGRT